MAKDNRPSESSKSETVPGGSKAADFKPGGRAAPDGPPENADRSGQPIDRTQAPVTTDAAASTPDGDGTVTTHETGPATLGGGPTRLPLKPTVPGRDEARGNTLTSSSPRPSRPSGLEPFDPSGGEPGEQPRRNRSDVPKGMGRFAAGADEPPDLSVRDFVGMVREFTSAARARNWYQVFQTGGAIAAAFAQLMNSGALFQVTQEDAAALAGADNLATELAQCRAELGATVAGSSRLSFAGGDPHPLSGSPMPLARAQGVDPMGFDPSTVLVIFELVTKLWNVFKNRG